MTTTPDTLSRKPTGAPAQNRCTIRLESATVREPVGTADLIIPVIHWRDPQARPEFRSRFTNGLNQPCIDYVAQDDRFVALFDGLYFYTTNVLDASPRLQLIVSIRDHHGIWIAPALVEALADSLDARLPYKVVTAHAKVV